MYLPKLAWLACGRLRSQGCWDLGPALAQASKQASSQVDGVLPCGRQQRCVTCQACASTPAPSHNLKSAIPSEVRCKVQCTAVSHMLRASALLPATKSPAQQHRPHGHHCQQRAQRRSTGCTSSTGTTYRATVLRRSYPNWPQSGRAGPPTDLCNTTVTPLQCGLARGGADIRCLFRQGSGGTGSPLTTTFPDPMLYSWRAAAACWASTGLRRPA